MSDNNKTSKKEMLINGALTAVYIVIPCIPTIALEWVASTVCRMALNGPTIAEYIILYILCLAGQSVFAYFLFKRKGFDNRHDSLTYWKMLLRYAVIIHSAAALISGFSVLISGSSVIDLSSFIFLCLFPKTELPLTPYLIPEIFNVISFIITEAIYVYIIYLGIKKGKIERQKESDEILNKTNCK